MSAINLASVHFHFNFQSLSIASTNDDKIWCQSKSCSRLPRIRSGVIEHVSLLPRWIQRSKRIFLKKTSRRMFVHCMSDWILGLFTFSYIFIFLSKLLLHAEIIKLSFRSGDTTEWKNESIYGTDAYLSIATFTNTIHQHIENVPVNRINNECKRMIQSAPNKRTTPENQTKPNCKTSYIYVAIIIHTNAAISHAIVVRKNKQRKRLLFEAKQRKKNLKTFDYNQDSMNWNRLAIRSNTSHTGNHFPLSRFSNRKILFFRDRERETNNIFSLVIFRRSFYLSTLILSEHSFYAFKTS